jgi:hypothetical protein
MREWRIEGSSPHVVRLEHGYWSGRASIWLDDELIYSRGFTPIDLGFVYGFEVDGAQVVVRVTCELGSFFSYHLHVGGRPVEPSATSSWTGLLVGLGCVLAVILALFVVMAVLIAHWKESVAPGGDTLAECLQKMPEPARTEVFTQDGQDYLLLQGESQAFPRFPSGPPMYVFDRTGRLVDWTTDSGDDDAFWKRWPSAAEGRAISREEMLRWPGATR